MEDRSIDISELGKRFHDGVIICSHDYADLFFVRSLIHYAWGNDDVTKSEVIKVEDDLIEKGIIPRRVEYEDNMNGYIYEGEEIIKDIKYYLWHVLYEDRAEREYEERLRKSRMS